MEFRRAFDPVRALGVAWTLLTRAPLTLLVGGILVALTDPDWGSATRVVLDDEALEDPRVLFAVGAIGLVGCCLALVLFLVNSLLRVGYAGAIQRVMVTGEERFADLIQERGLWLSMLVARLIKAFLVGFSFLPFVFLVGGPAVVAAALGLGPLGVLVGAFLALCYLPIWFYVLLGLLLVEQAVAVEGKSPVEALQRSWEVASGNRLPLLLFLIVMVLVELAGLLLCCIGIVLTSAWTTAAWYESYIRLTLPAPEEGMWVDSSGG